MAKKITNENASTISIDKKNATYVLDTALTSDVKFQNTKITDESLAPLISGVRIGNNLVVLYTPKTRDKSDNIVYGKMITTTVKNFFTSDYTGKITFGARTIDTSTNTYDSSFLYGFSDKEINNSSNNYIYGNSKGNIYTLTQSQGTVVDPSGNDTYDIQAKHTILDYVGNDKYSLSETTVDNIVDIKGNDKYSLQSNAILTISKEYAGNDTYDINNSTLQIKAELKGNDKYIAKKGSTLTVEDAAGKDTYTLEEDTLVNIKDYSNSKDTYNLKNVVDGDDSKFGIIDYGGADKYTFENAGKISNTFRINDRAGNDKYSFTDTNYMYIQDGAESAYVSGNDTYNVNKASGVLFLEDKGGNNKFTVKDSEFTDSTSTSIVKELLISSQKTGEDKTGNDTYTFKNVKGEYYNEEQKQNLPKIKDHDMQESIQIYDNFGNDKFNLDNVQYMSIIAEGAGKDTYTFKNVEAVEVQSRGVTTDESVNSDDKYTFTASDVTVVDSDGNDSYTIKKLDGNSIFINDKAGDKDKLIISGEKFANNGVIALADGKSSELVLFDTVSKGYVELYGFYTVENGEITGKGNGYIETVKVGNKTIKAGSDEFINNLNSYIEKAQTWISKHDLYAVVGDSQQADTMTELVNIFTGSNTGS